MAKLGSLLERQFKKLGITITDELKPLVSAEMEVPEAVAKQMDQGLLTIEAAKTNSEVNKVLRQSILGIADAKIDDIVRETGLAVGDAFLNEKNTYERISMLSKLLHEDGKKKGEGNSKDDFGEVLKRERADFGKKETDFQKKIKELSDTRERDRTEFALHKKLFGKDYALPKDLDNDIKISTASSVIGSKLKSLGLQARLNDAGQLIITDKDGNKAYTDRHEAIDDADSFFDGILTQNKLLNVSGSGNSYQQSSGGTSNIHLPGGSKNAAILNDIDAQLKGLPG